MRAEFEKELVRTETLHEEPEQPAGGKPPAPAKTGTGTLTFANPPAAQPVASTKFDLGIALKIDGGTATSTQNLSVPQRLPPYNGIFSHELQKEMNLSAEQCKRLSEVSADFWSRFKELGKENSDITDQQKSAKYAANINQLAGDCRKQIEAAVTPQQLEAYKKAVFPFHAFELLSLASRRVARPSASPAGRRTNCNRYSRSNLNSLANSLLRKK